MRLKEIKASEIKEESKAIILIGEPGSGKSYLISQMPKPLLVMDFDGKAGYTTYRRAKDASDISIVSFESVPSVDSISEPAPEAVLDFDDKLNELLSEDNMPYATVALDSLTSFGKAVLRRVIYKNRMSGKGGSHMGERGAYNPTQIDYGVQMTQCEYFLDKLLTLPCTVVVAAHEMTVEDVNGAELYTVAAITGKKTLAKALPSKFSEMWRTERYLDSSNTARLRVRCQGDERFAWCCSKGGLPQYVDNDWEAIQRMLSNT